MVNIVPTVVALCRRTLREFTDFSHSLVGWNTRYRVGRHTRSRQTSRRRNEIVNFKVNRTRIALSFLQFTRSQVFHLRYLLNSYTC